MITDATSLSSVIEGSDIQISHEMFDNVTNKISFGMNYLRAFITRYGKLYVVMEDQEIDDEGHLSDVTTSAKAYPAEAEIDRAKRYANDLRKLISEVSTAWAQITVQISQQESINMSSALNAFVNALRIQELIDVVLSL